MAYEITPELDEKIKERLATGQYSSAEEVLREALQALEWRDAEVVAIQAGIEDMEAGRVEPLREFDSEFRRRKNIPQDV